MFVESRRLKGTIIANTLLDFIVESHSKDTTKSDTWVPLELIHLASTILPDDLTASPLASLFSRTKQISLVPLSPSEQFLGAWFSELFKIEEKVEEISDSIKKMFNTLASYHGIPVEVIPISIIKKQIEIKYRNHLGPLRYYQMFGFLDMQKFIPIDPADIKTALSKNDFKLINFEPKESIIPAEVEKQFKDASAVIISAGDLASLTVLLSYEDIRKVISKCSGTVVAISPIGSKHQLISERESVLLEALGITPDLSGFTLLLKNVADTLIIDQNDSSDSQLMRDSGFNIVIEDLATIKENKEFVDVVLRSAKIDIEKIQLEQEEISSSSRRGNIEKLVFDVAKVPGLAVELPSPDSLVIDKIPEEQLKAAQDGAITITLDENNDGSITADSEVIQKTLDAIETSIAGKTAKSNDQGLEKKQIPDRKAIQEEIDKELMDITSNKKEKSDVKELETASERDKVETLLDVIENDDLPEDSDNYINQIEKAIENDSSLAIFAGNKLIETITDTGSEKIRKFGIKVFNSLSEERKIAFRRVVQSWLKNALDNPDFAIQEHQAKIMLSIAENDPELIGDTLKAFIGQVLTNKVSDISRERCKNLILQVAINNKSATKAVINEFLELFSEEKILEGDLWASLTSFDARLVGIELVENFSLTTCSEIAQKALQRDLGSFSSLLNDIVSSFNDGNMDKLLSIVGNLSEAAVRKAKRLTIAQKIEKLGSVQLETFAKSIKEDAKELESLVYEMVMNNEINAKLDMIEGKMFIKFVSEEDNDEENKK
ncbi:MAG: 2-phospho-L-lactate transferase [Candidatus Heimdallarchaeota archaeon LC_3]|nr:MAG: 2-phospho-L-lactate transferase [Candidatus Heimdallarchaeota archaeon LC_3]